MIVSAVVSLQGYSVRLTATSYTGTVSWFRVEGRDVPLGTGAVVEDRAAPLNVPITYYAKDTNSTVVAPPITVTATGPVLSDTMSNVARMVNVISYRPYRGAGRSVWHPVIGRSDPFVSVFPAVYPAGTLKLRLATNDERVALIQTYLQPGNPLLLRSTCPDRLDSMTFLMIGWSDPFPDDTMRAGPTYLEIEYQRVTDVTPAWAPPVRTYQDVINENATYALVLSKYNTYQGLADGVLK